MKLSEGIAYGKTVDLAVSSYNGLLELRNEILKSYNNLNEKTHWILFQ